MDSDIPVAEEGADDGWRDLLRPKYFISTIMLCLGVALFAFNEFFVSVALPSAVAELGKPWLLAWAFSLYLVFAIIGGAMAAYLKGRFGARLTLVAASIVFLVGTILASLATNSSHLVVGRLLQGFGQGITIALCYALIPVLFPKSLVPKVFGGQGIAWAAAAFGGPLIAGILTQYVSWRAAFASSLPAAVLFIVLVLFLVPRQPKADENTTPVPLVRLIMIGVGILAISICGLTESRLAIVSLLAAAAVSFLVFLKADKRNTHTLLPRDAFSPRALPGAGLWIILLMPFVGSAGAVYLMYGLQGIWGLKPAEAGLASAILALAWSFTGILVASIKSVETRNRLIVLGPLLLATGTGGIVTAVTLDTLWLVYPSQVVVGAGFGVSWGTLSQLLMDRASEAERDKTSALPPTLQSTGYAIGGAVFGLLANVAGLREGLTGEDLRGVLVPVFVAAFAMALVTLVFGWRTVVSTSAIPSAKSVP
ncbi:MFS transporter [Rhizobium sp. TH2]|uniref:MFS transporter n=1 Tax=Rhizobium sp. TH2 TaxID=2775403 RepID=UPI0035BE32F3